ncbi:MAG TPA: hypothetical protein VEU31_00730 [Candidatus Acidoferrales bacterium]|nr:hypothetical protein [Candidatus Acidoferrales bacterium]
MACERYREELLGAAAGWLEPEREMRFDVHWRACSACREEYERQKRLFDAVEAGLRERINEELPVGFAARVRARVNDRTAPRQLWFPRWVPAWSAVAAAAVLAAGLLVVHGIRRGAGGRQVQTAPLAANVAPHEIAKPSGVNSAETPGARTVSLPHRVQKEAATAASAEPEVLLPAAQKMAMVQLVEALRKGEVQGEMLLAANDKLQPVQIAPLEIELVEVKPLEESWPQPQ